MLAVLSIAVLFNLPETLREKQPFRWSLLKVTRNDIFDPLAMPAAYAMIFCYFAYGVILHAGARPERPVGAEQPRHFLYDFYFGQHFDTVFCAKFPTAWLRTGTQSLGAHDRGGYAGVLLRPYALDA